MRALHKSSWKLRRRETNYLVTSSDFRTVPDASGFKLTKIELLRIEQVTGKKGRCKNFAKRNGTKAVCEVECLNEFV
jgi:hypothetical protein